MGWVYWDGCFWWKGCGIDDLMDWELSALEVSRANGEDRVATGRTLTPQTRHWWIGPARNSDKTAFNCASPNHPSSFHLSLLLRLARFKLQTPHPPTTPHSLLPSTPDKGKGKGRVRLRVRVREKRVPHERRRARQDFFLFCVGYYYFLSSRRCPYPLP